MSENEDKYLFNDIYDEVFINLNEEKSASDTPLCDSLKEQKKQYSDFEKIAAGGMKVIYRAFDHKINRIVAYAELHKDCPRELYDPFIREARLTALLEHPNIISVYDIGLNEDDIPFFTMELKVGKNLSRIIREKAEMVESKGYNLRSLLEAYLKVCDAVSYAHSKKVLHLDLKPDNIQMGSFGEVIVCDWGLGKIIGDEDIEFDKLLFNPDMLNNVTITGSVTGTPGYMAPEQILKDIDKSEKTDIYSLGAMLYTILTAKCAFSGEVEEVLKKTVNGQFDPPVNIQTKWEVPESLNAVVMKAMSLKQEVRYESVEDLKEEVQNFLLGKTTLAENAGLIREAKLFYKRNFLVCNIVCFALFAIFCLGTAFLLKLQQKNFSLAEERNRAEDNFKKAEKEKLRYKTALDFMLQEKGLATAMLQGEYETIKSSFEKIDSEAFLNPVGALQEAEAILSKIAKKSYAYEWSQMQLNYIHYLRQDFHLYKELFKREGAAEEITNKIEEINKVKNIDQLSPIKELKELIRVHMQFTYSKGTVLKMVKFDGVKRKSKQEHSQLVEVTLRIINQDWKGKFIYDEVSQSLKIEGKNFSKIALKPEELSIRINTPLRRVSLVDSLPVRKLDISGTGITNLRAISDLEIEILIMKDLNVDGFAPLEHIKSLKRIVISKDQFTEKKLRLIPAGIDIIQE